MVSGNMASGLLVWQQVWQGAKVLKEKEFLGHRKPEKGQRMEPRAERKEQFKSWGIKKEEIKRDLVKKQKNKKPKKQRNKKPVFNILSINGYP